jgi:Tfp pilus assembly protein PilN
MISLPDIERAIEQGLDHQPTTYDSTRDRYKSLRNNVEKVIKGFYKQRGQDLLLNQGLVTATYEIPNTGQTLLNTILELENHILSIRLLREENTSYETLTETIQEFEATANTFLQETSRIYQLRYGHSPEAPPQYTP